MTRIAAAMLLAGLMLDAGAAVRAEAQAAAPFPQIPLAHDAPHSHRWAYLSIASGVALVGSSFALARQADRAYAEYLVVTDPARIEQLYDRAVRYDWFARGALLGGEALIATGLYLRFIRRPRASGFALVVEPDRCAFAWRF